MAPPDEYLITIDREEWKAFRRFEVWRKEWWAFALRRYDWLHGIGRTVYRVSFDDRTAKPEFSVPQRLDQVLLGDVLSRFSHWAKSLSRGMRTLWRDADGHIVLADIFGIYRLTRTGAVERYLSIPDFSDLHCVLPGKDQEHLLVTSTGTEEILEVNWDGTIVERIRMNEVFRTGANTALKGALACTKDRRLLPLDHLRHVFHVNWAKWLQDGMSMLISCHTPGLVAILRKDNAGKWSVVRQLGYFPHCHCPALDEVNNIVYVAVSRSDEIRAVDVASGETLWTVGDIRYGKAVEIVGSEHLVVGDCNGKRLVEINRMSGKVVRDCPLPGIPYGICRVAGNHES